MKKMLVLLAVVALAVPAFAQTDDAVIYINSEIQSFIDVNVVNDLTVTLDDPSYYTQPGGLDLAGAPFENQRARFSVTANEAYNLTLTTDTFTADHVSTTYKQVEFENLADATKVHGGSLFLDTDPGNWDSAYNDIVRWSGANGNIVLNGAAAGSHEYGIGGEFVPFVTPNEGEIASPGTYQADVTITATVQ